ncbi:MAG: Ldh family oxidoreductase [Bryobacteraceae bacterium]
MTVGHLILKRFIEDLLQAAGVSGPKAALVAGSLIAGNLRGVDSHGVQLLPYYLEQLEAGDMDAAADGHVVSENGCCLVFDGENGIGQWVADVCSDHAIRLAQTYGLGMAIARESNHFGAAAWWGAKMSAAGLLGIVVCNASPIVAPWQGKEPRFGTNPICVSVPGSRTWLLDMATTTVAAGKVFKAYINHQPEIPAGWATDSDGVPTTDTEKAYKGLLMPLGGYKGSGLAFLVEILSGVLGGGAMSTELGGIRWRGTRTRVSQTFLGIDVARFMPVAEFDARMTEVVERVKASAPAVGYDEVLVAGEPEWRIEEQRLRDGIAVPDGNWENLVKWAEKLGVAVPG